MATQILTLNVQGLRNPDNLDSFKQWLKCFNPALVCLQETHSISITEFASWFKNSTYDCVLSPGTNRSRGVGILIHRSFSIDQTWHDTDGRYVCAELSKQNLTFRLHCIYGPNTRLEGNNFFGSLSAYIDPLLLNFFCGDFNTVINPELDRTGCNISSPWTYNCLPSLSLLQTSTDSCDIWRTRHPNTKSFTWHRPDGSQHSRIDMIWIPDRLVGTVQSCEILPFFRSDHSYVHLNIVLPFNTSFTRSFWKLNTEYLSHEPLQKLSAPCSYREYLIVLYILIVLQRDSLLDLFNFLCRKVNRGFHHACCLVANRRRGFELHADRPTISSPRPPI